jgi:hypothetical protein
VRYDHRLSSRRPVAPEKQMVAIAPLQIADIRRVSKLDRSRTADVEVVVAGVGADAVPSSAGGSVGGGPNGSR